MGEWRLIHGLSKIGGSPAAGVKQPRPEKVVRKSRYEALLLDNLYNTLDFLLLAAEEPRLGIEVKMWQFRPERDN